MQGSWIVIEAAERLNLMTMEQDDHTMRLQVEDIQHRFSSETDGSLL